MASIYDEIGGNDGVAAAVDHFYAYVMDDGVLAPYFAGTDLRRQKGHLRAFLAAAVGGPAALCGPRHGLRARGHGDHRGRVRPRGGPPGHHAHRLGVAPDTIGAIGGRIAPLRAQIVSA